MPVQTRSQARNKSVATSKVAVKKVKQVAMDDYKMMYSPETMEIMNSVVIDNCIVSKFMGHGVRILPISLEKKLNPNLNINSLQKIEYGSRLKDNRIIQQLCDGILKYEDLKFN